MTPNTKKSLKIHERWILISKQKVLIHILCINLLRIWYWQKRINNWKTKPVKRESCVSKANRWGDDEKQTVIK